MPKAGGAAVRWRELVRALQADARRRQERFSLEKPYEGERAASFASLTGVADAHDPFLRMVRQRVRRGTSVIDVGAGAGRYALALAPEIDEVIAVEPSGDLLELLAQQARQMRIANLRLVESRWEDAGDLQADVVVCYGVMGAIEDAAPFMQKLDDAARDSVFVGLGSGVDVLRDPLWRHFHGTAPPPGPSFLDGVEVLTELDIAPRAAVLEYPTPVYDDLDNAVFAYRDLLELPATAEIDAELRRVLGLWLIKRSDGRLRVPGTTYTYAALAWSPSDADRRN